MITCDVLGYDPRSNNGLGNQMFCIATTLALAYNNLSDSTFPDLKLEHNRYYAETLFHKLDKSGDKRSFYILYEEPPYTSTQYKKINYADKLRIRGHFQSYKYFNSCKDYILETFQIPEKLQTKINNSAYNKLISESLNSVSLHVRRGDYLKMSQHYESLSKDYYQNALELIEGADKVFVFSDDIEWCKSNIDFVFDKSLVFVEGQTDVEDLVLMSKIKNNIIANSTFSWWGAYLNQNEDRKIIAPNRWFGPARQQANFDDLYPKEWIRV